MSLCFSILWGRGGADGRPVAAPRGKTKRAEERIPAWWGTTSRKKISQDRDGIGYAPGKETAGRRDAGPEKSEKLSDIH